MNNLRMCAIVAEAADSTCFGCDAEHVENQGFRAIPQAALVNDMAMPDLKSMAEAVRNRLRLAERGSNKTPVMGMLDRNTRQVRAHCS